MKLLSACGFVKPYSRDHCVEWSLSSQNLIFDRMVLFLLIAGDMGRIFSYYEQTRGGPKSSLELNNFS